MNGVKFLTVNTLLLGLQLTCSAQSLPVGTTAIEDYYRRSQLLGTVDTNVSFAVRPIFPKDVDPSRGILLKDEKLAINLLPLNLQTRFNSDHPYDWNDGPMIPAKGLQTFISAGAFMRYGALTVQLQPELVSAANSAFSTFNPNQYDVLFARYYDIYNNIDLPVRFGTTAYTRAYWGQSSIRINYRSMSVGLSTENLWWGPGIRNSLLMSNTAPGFLHFTLNTTKPLKTGIGSFEGQLIAGKPQDSGFPPLEPDHFYFGTDLYVPKPANRRYLAGIIVTWQPKWTPGLFLGFDQATQTYGKDLHGIRSYLPIFSAINSTSATDNPLSKQDKINSIFMRWLLTQEHSELYFEYGNYNNNNDLLQSLSDPSRSRAYIFGVRKLLPFKKSTDENILLALEVTQLQETSVADVQAGKEWYVSQSIRQGYTDQGQELGAGIGPGGNLQTLEVSWVKGLKKIGLQFERYVHNNDFYYYAFVDSQNYSQHWVDLSAAATAEWDYKHLIFNAKILGVKSLDYQWAVKQHGNDILFANQLSVFNLQVQCGASFNF